MHPILFKVPLPFSVFGHDEFVLQSFGVMTMLGVLAGALWLVRALRRIGLEERDAVGDLVTVCVLSGFLGARMLYVAVHPEVWHGPISLIAVWEGGIVSYGGFFGGALGGMWYARRHKIPVSRLGDAVLPALALGQVFGRIGCLLVGDDYGKPWDGAWAVRFPRVEGGLIPEHLVGVPLHPAQIYLSLMNLVIFLITAWLFTRRRFDGQVLAATMALYAIGRFLVEYTRGDDAERGGVGALSTAQWWSLGTIALAGVLYTRFRRRQVALP
ncbi:MAG: prolipoprotein diacylglyceryl transferase [Planctomycetota bacterium]|jgi:phosphatidylglycerol:prolipoprotein diacylglycerol transferase